MKNIVYLHTGSNQGDRLFYLESARKEIEVRIGEILKSSGIYETSAWGKEDQHDFLNQAFKVETSLSPYAVLEKIKDIEKKNGRKQKTRWGARTLDIDVLFYGNKTINTEKLTLPHPRLHKRKFVLVPLSEIGGDLIHPVYGITVNELLKKCEDKLEVRDILNTKH